jgi:hypothetical protein
VRIDVLDRSEPTPKIVEAVVGARQRPPRRRLRDPGRASRATISVSANRRIATLNPEFVYAGDGRYGRFARRD